MPERVVNGRRIYYHYRPAPDEAGPALVLVHGAGGSHRDWPGLHRWPIPAALYALDLPGHGRSPGAPESSVEGYAAVIAGFIADLAGEVGNGRIVVAGHSMGGAITLQIGREPPSSVIGLALIGTGARLPVADAFLEGALTDFRQTVTRMTRYNWSAGAAAAQVSQGLAQLAAGRPESLHADFIACNSFDARPWLAEIRLPTLVIGAAADRMVPLRFSETLAAELPDAHLVTLEDGGHMMMLEQPAAVAAAVNSFLARWR